MSLSELRDKARTLQQECGKLSRQLMEIQEDAVLEEERMRKAQVKADKVALEIKFLEKTDETLNSMIAALKASSKIKESLADEVLEEQRKSSKVLTSNYDKLKSFRSSLDGVLGRKDVAVDTTDMEQSQQQKLVAVVKKVQAVVTAKLTGKYKGASSSKGVRGGRGGGAYRGRGGTRGGRGRRSARVSSDEEMEVTTPKRKRETSSEGSLVRTTRSGRKAAVSFREDSDDDDSD